MTSRDDGVKLTCIGSEMFTINVEMRGYSQSHPLAAFDFISY